jgi:hypothetical protein
MALPGGVGVGGGGGGAGAGCGGGELTLRRAGLPVAGVWGTSTLQPSSRLQPRRSIELSTYR